MRLTVLLLALLLISPGFAQIKPSPSEVSSEQAVRILRKFAARAGVRLGATPTSTQFVAPAGGQRRWIADFPSAGFAVDAMGEIVSYWSKEAPASTGAASPRLETRDSLTRLTAEWAARLGLPAPIQITGVLFDRKGHRVEGRPGPVTTVFDTPSRSYTFSFAWTDARLVAFSVRSVGPSVAPRLLATPGPSDVSKAQALTAANRFLRQLGLEPMRSADCEFTLSKGFAMGMRTWLIRHPRNIFTIDAKTGKVFSFTNDSSHERFEKGDVPFVTDKQAAAKFLRGIGSRVGIPATAQLDVTITNGMVKSIGWVGQVLGTFRWSSQKALITCDLLHGRIINITLVPAGWPKR